MDLSTANLSGRGELAALYREVRAHTEALCQPLAVDDYQTQSITETSPPKWHIAHVSWFFENFLLRPYAPGYPPFHPRFGYLFNSYYETIGAFHPRPKRGLLSRPTVEEVYAYRRHVDGHMLHLLESIDEGQWSEVAFRVTLGLHHEQQHQELLLMDVKHNFSVNPLRPSYRARSETQSVGACPLTWLEHPGAEIEVGHADDGFAFDNETPRHTTRVYPHRLASRLVTNGEYLEFLDSGGYTQAEHWLADGWHTVRRNGWHAPLYWERNNGRWWQMTLAGMRPLDEAEPVCHVSYYEADAFARWAGKRLPSETEIELALAERPIEGNFQDEGHLHPVPAGSRDGQWYGDVWEWTSSPYGPYPGFSPLAGSVGEYNGKFMCNQMTLRGGACVTSRSHMRPTYRNFFYPHDRWQFGGIRLAEDGTS